MFEETFFRAGMQNLLTRRFKGPWISIIITSIIFSLIHLSYYGFIVRFALGVVLGLIFYYSGSLWLSILFHFLFNGIQVTVLYFITATGMKNKPDIEGNFPFWSGIFALLLLVYLFMLFMKISETEKIKYSKADIPGNDLPNWMNSRS